MRRDDYFNVFHITNTEKKGHKKKCCFDASSVVTALPECSFSDQLSVHDSGHKSILS